MAFIQRFSHQALLYITANEGQHVNIASSNIERAGYQAPCTGERAPAGGLAEWTGR